MNNYKKEQIKDGEMYCAIEGCGRVDETHIGYCIKHGRSPHEIKGKEQEDNFKKKSVKKSNKGWGRSYGY